MNGSGALLLTLGGVKLLRPQCCLLVWQTSCPLSYNYYLAV